MSPCRDVPRPKKNPSRQAAAAAWDGAVAGAPVVADADVGVETGVVAAGADAAGADAAGADAAGADAAGADAAGADAAGAGAGAPDAAAVTMADGVVVDTTGGGADGSAVLKAAFAASADTTDNDVPFAESSVPSALALLAAIADTEAICGVAIASGSSVALGVALVGTAADNSDLSAPSACTSPGADAGRRPALSLAKRSAADCVCIYPAA